jgi:hypothetical protein
LEEDEMKGRIGYLVIAVSLTTLDAAVTVYYGMVVCEGWSGDIWARGLVALFAALEATSLANVWAQAVAGVSVPPDGRSAMPIPAEARGCGDV